MPILDLFGMVFEWHDDKFALVHQNRGISLEEVASVFFDDCSICCGPVTLSVVVALPVLLSLPAPWLFLAPLWLLFVMMPVSMLSPCMRDGNSFNNVSIQK